MAEITISDLPSKTALLDSDLVPIDDGTQSYRVTGAQLREFLKVNFLPLGTIVWSQSNLATDNVGRLPLWTGEYIASAATLYPDFYAWVKKHTELCKTKEQYDAALAQFGECPFYVVDEEEGSLRLPKLQHYIKNATAEEGITQKEAGVPNITGTFTNLPTGNEDRATASGAFTLGAKSSSATNGVYSSGTGPSRAVDFSAASSDDTYGNSDTVTPAHTTLYPWVYAYNAAIAASVAQAAEFQQGLSGKADADLGNITDSGKETAVSWVLPDYENVIEVTNIAKNVFVQVEKDSFVLVFGSDPYSEDYFAYVSPDGGETKYIVGRRTDDTNGNTETTSFTFFVPAGWYFSNGAEHGSRAFIYPLRGAK